jgi:HAD superfamily hydrolase (TIGR01509 family)
MATGVNWFVFDLGNTVIKLAYEHVMENICKLASTKRDELVDLLEGAGGYRDLERGAITFVDFYDFLRERASYRGSLGELKETWADFFDGAMPGIDELLDRVRQRYRVAFLSNSNEVHADVIPRKYAALFRDEDRFIFSHRFKCAKPDPEMFRRALELIGALPQHAVLVDDLMENVVAASTIGMKAYQFRDSATLLGELRRDGLL